MKRHACQLSLIIATLAAAPAALAGAPIVKCVAPDGEVTLTDQPCSDGATTVRLETESDAGVSRPAVEHFPAPRMQPRRTTAGWTRPEPRKPSLARDVATLKAARMQLLLQDSGHAQRQPRLAGLD